jgi:hypothetical protein
MATARFDTTQTPLQYRPTGITRAKTKKAAILEGAEFVQCCPSPAVDDEMDIICSELNVSVILLLLGRC